MSLLNNGTEFYNSVILIGIKCSNSFGFTPLSKILVAENLIFTEHKMSEYLSSPKCLNGEPIGECKISKVRLGDICSPKCLNGEPIGDFVKYLVRLGEYLLV